MGTITIPMTILADEKGYLDRECPKDKCKFLFKVNVEDWENASNGSFCPMCGHYSHEDVWYTEEQIQAIRENATSWAMNYVQTELQKTFKKLSRNGSNNKNVKISYKPGRKIDFVNNPIEAKYEWELDIICTKCNSKYSVIGTGYFCPCCGANAVEHVADSALQTIRNKVNSIDEIKNALNQNYNNDETENICKSLIESALGENVSFYQKYAKHFFDDKNIKVRSNDFQIISKGDQLFKDNFSVSYNMILDNKEIDLLKLYFQQRHLIEHNGGIVDQDYLDKTNDHTYKLSQRLIVKGLDVLSLNDIIKKLCNGLRDNIT